MGSNPSFFKNCGEDCPVESVSWEDIQEFIKKLNQRESEYQYRLPTEAEWEYAARAGSDSAFANGGISELECGYDANLAVMGWYCGNGGVDYKGCYDDSDYGGSKCAGPHPVADKAPNAWGLYDMHGNVYEWCQDWYDDYPNGSVADPDGPSSGAARVLRGGSWDYFAAYCRSANRGRDGPGGRSLISGFRLAAFLFSR
jgi:formylglycine-generating enzyme required for sulfatase activity